MKFGDSNKEVYDAIVSTARKRQTGRKEEVQHFVDALKKARNSFHTNVATDLGRDDGCRIIPLYCYHQISYSFLFVLGVTVVLFFSPSHHKTICRSLSQATFLGYLLYFSP